MSALPHEAVQFRWKFYPGISSSWLDETYWAPVNPVMPTIAHLCDGPFRIRDELRVRLANGQTVIVRPLSPERQAARQALKHGRGE